MSGTTDAADELDAALTSAARLLARASSVAVLTGAGVSAASGVPTFRGDGGLWRAHRAEDLATPAAFARDPALVWEWYDWRRQRIAACAPNAAHHVLAAWSRRWPQFTLTTQNVDGLHERAGTRHVLRLHGSIWQVHCARPCAAGRVPRAFDRVPLGTPPRCASCGALERPSVVWFGEPLDAHVFAAAAAAVAAADICLVVGTSAVVFPAAGLIAEASRHGAAVIEINPDASALAHHAALTIRGGAEIVLPRLAAALGEAPHRYR